jgi:uncharacterized protein (TIGR03435 family)
MRRTIVPALALAALLAGASSRVVAQATPPAAAQFEVASVKLHTSADQRTMTVAQPGGRFVAVNIPLRMLIRTAYQLQDDQIVGGPRWMATDRFDIDARTGDTGPAINPQLLVMLQSLLADRFKLTTHREKREIAVFALERVRRDGPLGPGLRPTGCPDLAVDLANVRPCANISNGAAWLSLKGMPFNQFTPYLSPYVNRVVIDRTGLDARYDIDLKWTPDPQGLPPGAGPEPPAGDPNALSIFTAIQEQLGLKLSATRDMVEVLVIDTLEPPTPN